MKADRFSLRHLGSGSGEINEMLAKTGTSSMEELIKKTIPSSIYKPEVFQLPEPLDEQHYLERMRSIAARNKRYKSYIGLGYYNTCLPSAIQRNMLENPDWYTSYTPYQAEISQGRLEALLNFQTLIMELTGMELANASLLDEASAAAEAMIMLYKARPRAAVKAGCKQFFVDANTFPQTQAVLSNRAESLGIELVFGEYDEVEPGEEVFACLLQYPAADGSIRNYASFADKLKARDIALAVAADPMSLAMLKPPATWGADVVVGSTQRFGIPMFYGGPHAAFFATKASYKRHIPGRIIGISVDQYEKPALRMALQTREQHIKRERATSNICTAQALLASMAGMYAVYHGPEGLARIAGNIHEAATEIAGHLIALGYSLKNDTFFDTLHIVLPDGITADDIREEAEKQEINFYYPDRGHVQFSCDESCEEEEIQEIMQVFALVARKALSPTKPGLDFDPIPKNLRRKDPILKQEVFHRYRTETELMRYIARLARKDITLTRSMISLGSCTMKLNAATELMPLSWPAFSSIHPFVPIQQTEGYHQLINELEAALRAITGFEAVSFQPNSGATGEYTGLMVIRAYQKARGEGHRNIVLIPASAHGTNPASAVMAGLTVKVVDCDDRGNIDSGCLRRMAEAHSRELSSIMLTYPSTHGVFEDNIREIIDIVHECGGQVYMDGANMNAQVGLTSPGIIGADVCHLNLHKTFAIPHGGGGPGVGPIGVAGHLVEFLPSHPLVEAGGIHGIAPVAAAPYGSAGILAISHAYIHMLGAEGLQESTRLAILNANYVAASLSEYYDILYTGNKGFVAHEMILDCRKFKGLADISETDIAKRLMDYGFHAPTLSFPVHGTLMMEPTESESKAELDHFIEAMIDIYHDIMDIAEGRVKAEDSVLRNAPHTASILMEENWDRPYSREKAAFPLEWVRENKYWPTVSRVNEGYGDRNLVCSCEPIDSYSTGD